MATRSVEDVDRYSEEQAALELVLVCLQAGPTAARRRQIRLQVQDGVSWEDVLRIATTHRVFPLVFDRLAQACGDRLPDGLQAHVEDVRHRMRIYNTFLVKELGRVLALFDEAGISTLTLKGPVLAQTAYGSVHQRPYTDLDVLLSPEDFAAAERLLLQHNYVPFDKLHPVTGWRKRLRLFLSRQWPVKRAHRAFRLDLHTAILPPGYGYSVAFEALRERSRCISLGGGVTVPGLAQEDALQVLCFQGAKDQWRTLGYVADVAHLIAASDVDWDEVLRRARRMRGERVLRLGLHLATRLLDAPVPSHVLGTLDTSPPFEQMAHALEARLETAVEPTLLSYPERVRLYLLIQDTWVDRARYVFFSLTRNILSLDNRSRVISSREEPVSA